MQIVDILGREVKVGDIVVSTNNSSSYQQIHVVTRIGSTDRVQVNGCSYVMAEYMMICTEQYMLAKGVEATKELQAEYAKFFEGKQVQKKAPSPKFLIQRLKPYGSSHLKPRYFVVKVAGTRQEMQKQLQEFYSKFDTTAFGLYFQRESLNKKSIWCYTDLNLAKSMKDLRALGLENAIDMEVVQGMQEYCICETFSDR